MTTTQPLAGLYEIAQMTGCLNSTVAKWRERYDDFPRPLAELKMGPVFDRSAVAAFLARHPKLGKPGANRITPGPGSRHSEKIGS